MKILIPMSGSGNRFREAGYPDPKPLIKVNGRPIIEYVVRMFPGETDFIFVCRDQHLRDTDMRKTLLDLVPTARILSMPGAKLGPVYSALQAQAFLDDDEPVIVNYCDFFMDWDYEAFKVEVARTGCDGNVVSYRGFHPHLLHEKNFYASSLTNAQGRLVEIREKHSFTPNKGDSPQSVGTYYFSKGSYVKKYFQETMDKDLNLNGEYYVSLVYNLLVRDSLQVDVYDQVRAFCQWGTPQDLEEYRYWETIFNR